MKHNEPTSTAPGALPRDIFFLPSDRVLRGPLPFLIALFVSCALSSSAAAADFDGSKPLLCAPVDTVHCVPGGECVRGAADNVNLPGFLKVDFTQRQVTTVDGERTTAILASSHEDNQLILQGVQTGRAWSMSIAGGTGDMTLTVAGNRTGHVVFGACTPL